MRCVLETLCLLLLSPDVLYRFLATARKHSFGTKQTVAPSGFGDSQLSLLRRNKHALHKMPPVPRSVVEENKLFRGEMEDCEAHSMFGSGKWSRPQSSVRSFNQDYTEDPAMEETELREL